MRCCSICGSPLVIEQERCQNCRLPSKNATETEVAAARKRMADADLASRLHDEAADILSISSRSDDPGEWRKQVERLSPPLRSAYTLWVLECEVDNGGFYQWLTNFTGGTIVDLTVAEARRILATTSPSKERNGGERLAIVERVGQINDELTARHPAWGRRFGRPNVKPTREEEEAFEADFEDRYEPELERLDNEWYELEGPDPMWAYFVEVFGDTVPQPDDGG